MATFYVRPDTSHSSTRNGLTYATAWGGWSEITWGTLVAGSVLAICGSHSYVASISVGAHGGALGNRVTLDGQGYTLDPGSITFSNTGTMFLQNDRAHTVIQNLTSINRFFITGTATDSRYTGNSFNTPGSASSIAFFANSTNNHADIEVDHNTFTTTSAASTSSAIQWFSGSAQNSTMTRCNMHHNTFTNFNAQRSVVHFRSQSDSNAATRMQDIKFNDNTFVGCSGIMSEFTSPGTVGGADTSAGIQVLRNSYINCRESTLTAGLGGAISVWGFANSQTVGFGLNHIANNTGTVLGGSTGFVDVFWGAYVVELNNCDTLTSTTIDANAYLLDSGTHDTVFRMNIGKNVLGKPNQVNSGCGIMILDTCSNNFVYGNVISNCRVGIFYGASGAGGANTVSNNTFLNVTVYAVYISATASLLASQTVCNNIFNGSGTAVNNLTAITWTTEDGNLFNGFSGGFVNQTPGSHDQVNIDPSLNLNTYSPLTGSPCIGSGVWYIYPTDYNGKPFKIPTSIGAVEDYSIKTRSIRV